MEKKWRIPQRLDEPGRLLFLTISEVMVMFAALFGGIITKRVILGLLLGFGAVFLARRFKTLIGNLSPATVGYWLFNIGSASQPASWKRHWRS